MISKRSQTNGFTLLELLVTVSIIGLLATVGIPLWKKQVQKAKKSEAKVGLAAIYSVQKGFFTEFGAFGSNLTILGFEIEPAAKYYTFGFPDASCNGTPVKPIQDPINAPASITIFERQPEYYNEYTVNDSIDALSTINNCAVGNVSDSGDSFLATASGALIPGLFVNPPLADMDLWTIDDFSQISNIQDGVR